mmetsp:Transcript_56511/g.163903  ORF Transcript_56511/g.163903 Transcript_56511/m.163903 type:complete len:395 (-) Transcript_56511:249-1433(-)
MPAAAGDLRGWAAKAPPFVVAVKAVVIVVAACASAVLLWARPLLTVSCVALALLVARTGLFLERHGLFGLLPKPSAVQMQASLFDLLGIVVSSVAVVGCNAVRLAMLVCMELDEHQKQELLTGMSPEFRQKVFRQPAVLLLPSFVRHLLFGRDVDETLASLEMKALPGNTKSIGDDRRQRIEAPARGPVEPAQGAAAGEVVSAHLRRSTTAESLLDLVHGMQSVARSAEAVAQVTALEKFLQRKVMSDTMSAAKSLAATANAQVWETVGSGCSKVGEFGQGVREVCARPRTQVATASAVGGAVALGSGGAAAGFASGGAVGAAIGLVPAALTFGLSIPIGAAIGGGIGAATGAGLGSAAGLVSGGALGYFAYGSEPRAPAAAKSAFNAEAQKAS